MLSGWEALLVGGLTFAFGMNPYAIQRFTQGFPGGGDIAATAVGCGLGAFIGEGIAQAIALPRASGRAKYIFTHMVYTALAAAIAAGTTGMIIFAVSGGTQNANILAMSAVGGIAAIVASGRIGMVPYSPPS